MLRSLRARSPPHRSLLLRSRPYSSARLSLVLLSSLPRRSECSSLAVPSLVARSLVVLSPVAFSTVRRVRYLRVCSRCILRIVSVVPSDRVILSRVILDRVLSVR